MILINCRLCIAVYMVMVTSTASSEPEIINQNASLAVIFPNYSITLNKPEIFDSRYLLGTASTTISIQSGGSLNASGDLNMNGGLLGPINQAVLNYNLPISASGTISISGYADWLQPIVMPMLVIQTGTDVSIRPGIVQIINSVPEPSNYLMMLSGLIIVSIGGLRTKL